MKNQIVAKTAFSSLLRKEVKIKETIITFLRVLELERKEKKRKCHVLNFIINSSWRDMGRNLSFYIDTLVL